MATTLVAPSFGAGFIAAPQRLTHIANFLTGDTYTVQGKLPNDWFTAAPSTTVFTTVSTSPVPLSTVHPAVRIML